MNRKDRVLIVDNKPEMLMQLSMLVGDTIICNTVVTNNPYETERLIKNNGIDVVVTEYKMPGLDGMDVLEKVHDIDKDIPVIIMSDIGTVETALDALKKGAFDFIMKPFRKERIVYSINRALDNIRLKKENELLKQGLDKSVAIST